MKRIHLLSGLMLLVVACGRSDIETIVIRGSDTEVNLVLQLAEQFMDEHDRASIAVTGGGSGTGIAALINKKTDIANSSRAFKDAEMELAQERGINVTPIVFAVDAISFAVHASLEVDSLSVEQIRKIYTGTYQNWSEVGGPDAPISLYGRQGNSGTFVFVQENILKADYAPTMKQMNGTSQILEGIKNDRYAIGYVGIGYVVKQTGEILDGLKVLAIQGDGQDRAFSPTDFAHIVSGDYQITRPLYQYVDGKPSGLTKAFLEFELSPVGQEIIGNNGYFAISASIKAANRAILE